VGTLINYERSLMGNDHLWVKIDQQLEAKENVVLFANHQSEADAAFIPLLTQGAHPGAERMDKREYVDDAPC
jgi:glycerol-3-phosphate O-acyltransferase